MKSGEFPSPYVPDYRLRNSYQEANTLDEAGLEALCPSYLELAENELRYRDETILGQGSTKSVYRSWDCRSKRWVAMARLREDRGPEFYDHFVHEAWLTSSLSHPNIIPIYDVGVDGNGRPFFTMDLKGATTLGDLVKDRGMQARRELLGIFVKICDAMAYAHSRGILHLDLKPENVQVDEFGEVLVCDWGLGRVVGGPEGSPVEFGDQLEKEDFGDSTMHGEVKGSFGFMAPEQVLPGAPKDARTDVFALGCILHTLLTGESPRAGRTDQPLRMAVRRAFPPPRRRYPHRSIPESLEAVVMKACSQDPEDRYPSAFEIGGEIERYLAGHATEAEEPGFVRAAWLFVARHRIGSAVSLLVVVLFSILSAVFIQRLDRERLATNLERNRASEFESKADTIASLYQSELAQSAESRVDLARSLATSANSLKNLGVFENPGRAIPEAQRLSAVALALDPECARARFECFALHCVTMNFRAALRIRPPANHNLADFMEFAEAFPDYDFAGPHRPSAQELANFFRRAREINPRRAALMERILSYDAAFRTDRRSYDEVVAALLYYLNGEEPPICDYRPESSFLAVTSDGDLSLLIPPGGSGRCLLRYLFFRSLELNIAGKFDLSDLNLLPIESLDLRNCSDLTVRKPVYLPLLRKVSIRSGSIQPKVLRSRIQSQERFEIVVSQPRR